MPAIRRPRPALGAATGPGLLFVCWLAPFVIASTFIFATGDLVLLAVAPILYEGVVDRYTDLEAALANPEASRRQL